MDAQDRTNHAISISPQIIILTLVFHSRSVQCAVRSAVCKAHGQAVLARSAVGSAGAAVHIDCNYL